MKRSPLNYWLLVFLVVVIFASGGFGGYLVFREYKLMSKTDEGAAADLNRLCTQGSIEDGFHTVTITEDMVVSGDQTITVPCAITLVSGVHLQIKGSQISSKDLYITADASDSSAKVTITNSDISGHDAGFQVSLRGNDAVVSIQDSVIKYARSIGIALGSRDADLGVRLHLQNSNIHATSEQGEGIILSSTGEASINYSSFITPATLQQGALLVGSICSNEGNSGLTVYCESGD